VNAPASILRRGVTTARARIAVAHPAIGLLFVIAVAVAGGVAYVLQLKGYFVMPDELTYQRDALYIADHFRPVPPSDVYYNSISQLGPLIQTPAWALTADVGTALDVAHVLNVVVFATSCVPVYLLTRRITESMPASLLAGAAAVAVPWFAMAGTLMTEPVAYPAFCWAVLAIQRAVAQPGVRGDIVGLAGVGLAVGARSHLILLGAVLVVAMLVREGLAARDEGARVVVRRHPVLLAAAIIGVTYVVVAGKSPSDLIGNYGVTTEGDLLPAGWFGAARTLVTSAALACAGITLPLAVGWALGALGVPARREAFAGALIILLALVATAIVAGSFTVRFSAAQNDRYVAYLAPLLFTGTAAALVLRPFRAVPIAIAGVGAVVLYATTELPVEGLTLISPAGAFRVVIDGRARLFAGHFGIADARPTAVVAVLVATALVVVIVAMRKLPATIVAGVVGLAVLGYGVAETIYTLRKVDQTQAGASPEFVASRGWADRALPEGQELNALIGFVGDPVTTIRTWWDAVYYNRDVDQVYQVAGTPPQQQATHAVVEVDPRTGALRGLPSGYLLAAADPVHVGLRDAHPVARLGPVEMVRVGTHPRAAFVLETPNADGAVPAGQSVVLRVFGDAAAAQRTLTLNAVARTGPLRLAVADERGRRLGSVLLAKDAPGELRVTLPASSGTTTLRVTATPPRSGAVPAAVVQTLGVDVARAA
jgi:Dolichyl-phosphate-mannose-protein mannosyltransferase